jgi:hypothetical protein
MGYLLKAGLGLTLFFGGIVLFNVQLQELLEIGTCASGNTPYQISQPCPEGTGTKMLLLVGSIFGGLIGAALFAFRGDPPWGKRRSTGGMFGLGVLAWGLFFAGTGVALLLGKPYGEVMNGSGDVVARPDSQLGATITAVTFLIMGVPALLIGVWTQVNGLRSGRDERPAPVSGLAPASVPKPSRAAAGGGDTLGKIERLQKLRESGALSDSEFEREKAKILAE